MKIGIMTDVNAGIDYVEHDNSIVILRSSVNFGNDIYVDGKDITADEFYKRIKNVESKEDIPSTSAPALGDIYDAFDKFIEEGYTHVIHFPISFELSATGKTVTQVAEEYKDKLEVTVINTKTACYMQGYLVMNAWRMLQEGASIEFIVEETNRLMNNSKCYFAVQNLDYLVKNGRLSGASGFLGTLLKIKPILEISADGKIVTKEKVKTAKKALLRVVELIKEYVGEHENCNVFVMQALAMEDANFLKQEIIKEFPNLKDVEIHHVAPAVGAHTGWGVSGIGVYKL